MRGNTEVGEIQSPERRHADQAEGGNRRAGGLAAPESATLGERRMTLAIKTAQGKAETAKADLTTAELESARATRILITALVAAAFLICCFAIKIPVVG